MFEQAVLVVSKIVWDSRGIMTIHDDVSKWKHFPRYWPLEFTGPGESPAQRPVTRCFDVYFGLRLNKRLSKQPWGWWFETLSWSLWCHCNVYNYSCDDGIIDIHWLILPILKQIKTQRIKNMNKIAEILQTSLGAFSLYSSCILISFTAICSWRPNWK